jgi:cytochrome c peroxidase
MITILSLLIACSDASKVQEPVNPQITDSVTMDRTKLAAFQPIPVDFFGDGDDPSYELVSLGGRLFREPKLSGDGKISCNSCHDLDTNGADKLPFSLGHDGHPVGRNSPTVFNAAGQIAQFWDGRAKDVEEQALGPILAPGEMATASGEAVVQVLKNDPTYVADFKDAFPSESDPITFKNVGVAIGAFERTLAKPSRWDKFLMGDDNALGDDEKRGVTTFVDLGCSGCHAGALLGGSAMMKLGVVQPWPNQQDQGKFDLTKSEVDRMVFKVAPLRYATETAPYFHDASAPDLKTAIRMMARHQLGKELTDVQVRDIEAWLGSTAGPVE